MWGYPKSDKLKSTPFLFYFLWLKTSKTKLILTNFFLLLDPPGAPGKPVVSDIDATEMTVTWTAPESDGGNPVIGYFVEKKEAKSSRWTRINSSPLDAKTMKMKDLTEKSKYHFRVFAANKAGEGPASEPSDVHVAKPPYGKWPNIGKMWMKNQTKGTRMGNIQFVHSNENLVLADQATYYSGP